MTLNLPEPPPDGGLRSRLLRGTVAKWTDQTGWTDSDGIPLPETMFVVSYTTALERWTDHGPEHITEHPLPDPKLLNSSIPQSEWRKGLNGAPEPPWKLIYVFYMVDEKIGMLYTFRNSTWGTQQLYEQLVEQIETVSMIRNKTVRPIVHLEKRPMPTTNFGMKAKPHMQILEWRIAGNSGDGDNLPVPPQTPQLSGPTTIPTDETADVTSASAESTSSIVRESTTPVKTPTVGEVIADEMPPWA